MRVTTNSRWKRQIIRLPNGGTDPFTPSDEHFFLLRTNGLTMTTVAPDLEYVLAHRDLVPMGYSQLWAMCRVALQLAGAPPIRYGPAPIWDPTTEEEHDYGHTVGSYYVFALSGDGVFGAQEKPLVYRAFGDRDGALASLREGESECEACLVAQLYRDIFWH